MPILIDGQTFYRPAEACQLAGISKTTLNRWTKEGVIPSVTHTDRHGWRLFTEEEISRIRNEATKVSHN